MDGLKEHLKLTTPKELKILTLNTDKFVHNDFWSRIDEIVADYTKIHPLEMEIIVRENAEIAANQFNKHGLTKEKGTKGELRHHMRIPADLMTTLTLFCPELFWEPKNYHKFMKRYKGLCAYE